MPLAILIPDPVFDSVASSPEFEESGSVLTNPQIKDGGQANPLLAGFYQQLKEPITLEAARNWVTIAHIFSAWESGEGDTCR